MPTTEFNLAEELSSIDLDHIRHLQSIAYTISKEHGFHEDDDQLRKVIASGSYDEGDVRALRNHYGNRLMLIVGEVGEAHEQLRMGRRADEAYYLDAITEGPRKPEGVPSELADVVIRAFDLAAETGIDLAAHIAEKMVYNNSRPYKHGKKF